MKNNKKTYSEKLKDPRWQKKRLEIMQRDNFTCRLCGDDKSTLNIHHLKYSGDPWEAPNDKLLTLCEECHIIIDAMCKNQEYQNTMKVFKYNINVNKQILFGITDSYSFVWIHNGGKVTCILIDDQCISKIEEFVNYYKSLKP